MGESRGCPSSRFVRKYIQNVLMLHRFKMFLFHRVAALKVCWYRLRGLEVGEGCIISGSPDFRLCRGSCIRLGKHVVLHSRRKYNTLIRQPMALSTVEPGACIELADHVGMSGAKIVCAKHVSIGEYTIVGPDSVIYDCHEHDYSPEIGWLGRKARTGTSIRIGKRCYLGMRCIILRGVTIGDDCVIGAGAVVSEDVPSGHIALGNPAVISPLPERLGGPGA